jgi:hypothetical protein
MSREMKVPDSMRTRVYAAGVIKEKRILNIGLCPCPTRRRICTMRKKVTMRMEAGLRVSVAGVISSIRMKKTKNWLEYRKNSSKNRLMSNLIANSSSHIPGQAIITALAAPAKPKLGLTALRHF